MHYYLCAGYAYHYLFATTEAKQPILQADLQLVSHFPRLAPPEAFDPRFRLACDLYNTGLAKCLAAAQKLGRLDPRGQLQMDAPAGDHCSLSVVHHGFSWKPDEFGPFLFSQDYRVEGLVNHYDTYGLGVPLIVRRAAVPPPEGTHYPQEVCFPATAFFRFEGGLAELVHKQGCRLELYNPLRIQTVEVRNKSVPLQTDLTTPLAYMLSGSELNGAAYLGFLRPEKLQQYTGIYMLEPYQPDKIPVLMVHGLLSSPLTWAPLFNDLRADPLLRDHYQFWFFYYPTADPYLNTAADLRQALYDLRASVDPAHKDAAFDQMVLVGHSMGGLISRLLTEDSGNDFWGQVSKQPFEEVAVRLETKEELRRTFFFEPVPWVRRVIFVATPHQGSLLSPSPVGRLAARLVCLPGSLMTVARDIARDPRDFLPEAHSREITNSVDLLDPKSPSLQLVASKPKPQRVAYHSVIGVLPTGACAVGRLLANAPDEPWDGVVTYRSAHREDTVSEVTVPADHERVHQHPLAVVEVRRILGEHLQSVAPTLKLVSQEH
jgi:pimeloyl-ACP methyl ester carboxylesterase